ncbi:unnamed protein product [Trifolium pratense]|uniref:Uncharacterized protein n=1 Tax=Trifolium pratense TaxID=57577 RepID=A0ACB0K2P3_TRIPR|nr:unnamed protein product [Trifolium pratense]
MNQNWRRRSQKQTKFAFRHGDAIFRHGGQGIKSFLILIFFFVSYVEEVEESLYMVIIFQNLVYGGRDLMGKVALIHPKYTPI